MLFGANLEVLEFLTRSCTSRYAMWAYRAKRAEVTDCRRSCWWIENL